MPDKTLKIKVFHFDPTVHNKPYYKTYDVPFTEGMRPLPLSIIFIRILTVPWHIMITPAVI